MSKFDEMSEVARDSVLRRQNLQLRCVEYLGNLLNGFLGYAEIPLSQMRFLRWNRQSEGISKYLPPEDGGTYTVFGAATQDEEGFWRIGIELSLGAVSVSFILCATEQQERPIVKIGPRGKATSIDLQDEAQSHAFYEQLVTLVKECLEDPKTTEKAYGFGISAAADQA